MTTRVVFPERRTLLLLTFHSILDNTRENSLNPGASQLRASIHIIPIIGQKIDPEPDPKYKVVGEGVHDDNLDYVCVVVLHPQELPPHLRPLSHHRRRSTMAFHH